MTQQAISKTVKEISDLLQQAANMNYIGEPISQLEHALQAAHFATKDGLDNEGILAALLHDIGHLIEPEKQSAMGKYGVADHEKLCAQYLRNKGFSEKIAGLITGHVVAKRYLVTTSESYYQRLSPASRKTLEYQGGKMNQAELTEFRKQPYFREILQVRLCDEKAKEIDLPCAGLNTYIPLIKQHLTAQD